MGTLVGAGADLFTPASVPTAIEVLFAVRFTGAPDELDGDVAHPIACRVYDPDGTQRGEQGASLTATGQAIVQGFAAQLLMPIGMVVAVPETGTYSFEFEIDRNVFPRVPIHIVTLDQLPQR